MEKVGLSFVIGAVVGASFKTSINGVKTSIGDINREVKQLSSRRNELVNSKNDCNILSSRSNSHKKSLYQILCKLFNFRIPSQIYLKQASSF